MSIVAVLQNQWFLNPPRIAQIYEGATPEHRARLNARYLFYKSLTGRRIKAAFGEDLCNQIIWEEASTKVAGKSDGVFPADVHHIANVIRHFRPSIVLTFGKVAAAGVLGILKLPGLHEFRVIAGPHPAARYATVRAELDQMARDLCDQPTSVSAAR